jgi:amino acid transporter
MIPFVMPKLTIFYALLLIALGVGGYFASGQASVTALIPAFIGASRGLPGFLDVLSGEEVERPQAAIAQGVLVIVSAIYVILGIKSFVAARKAS